MPTWTNPWKKDAGVLCKDYGDGWVGRVWRSAFAERFFFTFDKPRLSGWERFPTFPGERAVVGIRETQVDGQAACDKAAEMVPTVTFG
jgi:hypothetical protein